MTTIQITRCGLSVALLAVASSVSVAVGPVPFTLQTLALAMLPVALGGREAVRVVAVYLLLGALGLPVFSGFSGGLGHLAGPTGGYLWGFLAGMIAAAAVLEVKLVPERIRETLAVTLMLLVAYGCGTAQLMALMSLDAPSALALAVIPFLLPDAAKLAVGVGAGRAVRRALSSQAHVKAS